MWFQYLLVQCLITITGDGCVHITAKFISREEESWLSFSAEDRAALWEFQANRIKLGWGEVKRKWEGAISTLWSEELLFFLSVFCKKESVTRLPPLPPATARTLNEGFSWFHGGIPSGAFGHVWLSASCSDVSYKNRSGLLFLSLCLLL